MRWFVSDGTRSGGPFDDAHIVEAVQRGELKSDSFIRDDQNATWIRVSDSPFAGSLPSKKKHPPMPTRIKIAIAVLSLVFVWAFVEILRNPKVRIDIEDVPPPVTLPEN